MSISRYCLLLAPMLAFLAAATPSPETAADLERNRQLLQKWKAEPKHYARLRRDLHDFWELSDAKRGQLRQLDRALHQLEPQTRKRLWKVAERYLAWLERLPEDERRRIEETKDAQERLRLIRTIRERQWIERLPRKVQADLDKLPVDARSAEVARLRHQERQQRLLWKRPVNVPRVRQPVRPADLSPDARRFIEKQLLPRLTPEEKRQYNSALGHWPNFPRTVKELAKHHPVLPPLPPPHKAIVRFEDLPDRAKVEAGSKPSWERREDVWKRLRQVEGQWPEWALLFHSLLSKSQRQRMPPLGASRPEDFPVNVRDFLKKPQLGQKVSKPEWRELRALQGKWPDYPLYLLRLAEKHKLEVPGMSLPDLDW